MKQILFTLYLLVSIAASSQLKNDPLSKNDSALNAHGSKLIQSLTLTTPSVIYSSPITFANSSGLWTGTLSLNAQSANTVFAAPNGSSSTPTFRSLVAADIPPITTAKLSDFPSQATNGTKVLGTDGTNLSWVANGTGSASTVYFTVLSQHLSTNPTSATTYFFGSVPVGMTTTAAKRKVVIPVACTLVGFTMSVYGANTATTESSSIYFRLNNTTDITLSTAVQFPSVSTNTYYSMSLNQAIAAGDTWETKWVTPTWTTAPTNATVAITYFFKL